MSKHSPAPWYIDWPRTGSRIAWVWDRPPLTAAEMEAGERRYLVVTFGVLSPTDAANLRLIAAAPLLYAALRDMLAPYAGQEAAEFSPEMAARLTAARAALAAATEDANV